MNKLIFGKNETTGIVNITCVDGLVYIYKLLNGQLVVETKEHIPYALTTQRFELSSRLRGKEYYKYKTPILEQDYEDVRGNGIYKPRSKEEGFMLSSGATYFKGLKPSDLSLLSFDIETTTLDPNDPEAKIVLISSTFRDRNGKINKVLFDIHETLEYSKKNYNEAIKVMINNWCAWVRQMDPDILLGHNIFGFDLPYLNTFAPLTLGRDGSEVIFDKRISKKRKDGSQSYDYNNCHIHGREVIDTMFLAITYDVGREFPSYGLKRIEKHLKLVDSSRIEWNFDENPVREVVVKGGAIWLDFCNYCRDDADSPIKMFDIMASSLFYLNQSIPKKFQQMINEATGSQIDSFMIRAYLQDGWSLPKSSKKESFEGAISAGIPGIYENVRKVDVASLYPSIMLQYEYYPRDKDHQRYFLKALEYFTNERLKNKALASETGDKYYDDLQGGQKIFINSVYGMMGADYLLFNEFKEADAVTAKGRDILQQGVIWATGYNLKKVVAKVINKGKPNEHTKYKWVLGDKVGSGRGYTLANVDTDSFSITNGIVPTKEDFAKEINELNSIFDEKINWADDGVFKKVIVNKAKNYVLQKHENWCKPSDFDKNGNVKLKFKGSSFTDQKKEPALKEFMNELIKLMLDNKASLINMNAVYEKYCIEALNITDINRWSVKKTITKSVLNPTRTNEKNVLTAIVNEGFSEGDKVWLYTANNNQLKLIKYFNHDADNWHYVKRVYDTLCILTNLIDIKQFKKYHLKSNRSILEDYCKNIKDVI